jgi:hypothetical protein
MDVSMFGKLSSGSILNPRMARSLPLVVICMHLFASLAC